VPGRKIRMRLLQKRNRKIFPCKDFDSTETVLRGKGTNRKSTGNRGLKVSSVSGKQVIVGKPDRQESSGKYLQRYATTGKPVHR
jgi:hypothetical protein